MQRRPMKNPAPMNMIFLREALANPTITYDKDGELVKQANYIRTHGRGEKEQFVVILRKNSVAYHHLRWNQGLNNGEGDWTAINALACYDLDELYSIASVEVKEVLDSNRWNPV